MQMAMATGILAALTLPLLPQYIFAFTGRAAHTFPNPRSLWDLIRQLLPTLPMLVAAFIAALFPRLRPAQRVPIPMRSIELAVTWAVIPLVLLFAAAKLTGSDLFVNRYALPYVPGIALCFGMALEYLSTRLRTGLVLLVFLIPTAWNCLRGDFPSHTDRGNWAAAIAFVDSQREAAPAFMRSPFPESISSDWRNADMHDSVIYSPLAYYPSRADWHPLPVAFTDDAGRAIDDLMSTTHSLFFVELGDRDPGTEAYLDYFRSKGNLAELGDFEGVKVFRLRW
jgi:hypothetical protein